MSRPCSVRRAVTVPVAACGLLITLAACAPEAERGCVQVKRYSKEARIALRVAAEQCVREHRPGRVDAYVALVHGAQFRNHLKPAGAVHCDLDVTVSGEVAGTALDREFHCRIDVLALEQCLERATSNVDVGLCTERAVSGLAR